MRGALVVLFGVFLLGGCAVTRGVDNNFFTSSSRPAVSIKVNDQFGYLGNSSISSTVEKGLCAPDLQGAREIHQFVSVEGERVQKVLEIGIADKFDEMFSRNSCEGYPPYEFFSGPCEMGSTKIDGYNFRYIFSVTGTEEKQRFQLMDKGYLIPKVWYEQCVVRRAFFFPEALEICYREDLEAYKDRDDFNRNFDNAFEILSWGWP